MPLLRKLWTYFKPRITTGGLPRQIAWLVAAYFVFAFALLPALGFELVRLVDRKGRLSNRATWGAGATIGVVLMLVVSSLGRPVQVDQASVADGGEAPAVGLVAAATPLPDPTPSPTSSPTAIPEPTPVLTASPRATPAPAEPISFSIVSPKSGSTNSDGVAFVEGLAPPGATVVQDISFSGDQTVLAGPDGTWSMSVSLFPGANELTFRVGDDRSTETHLTVTMLEPPDPDVPDEEELDLPVEPVYTAFEDGTWEVKSDIKPGTYRLREPAGLCYWARLKGFDGSLKEIIANDSVVDAYAVVTIGKKDKGFESQGCGEWTKDLSRVTESTSRIDFDGTYIVGKDIKPGKWKSSGGDLCYWARLKSFSGTLGAILANGVRDGRVIVTIRSGDKGFQTKGCGTWKRS